MSDRRFLIVGLALLATGLIGMSLQASAGGWWGMPMGMMGWWESQAGAGQKPPVAGAPSVEVEATEFIFQPDPLVIEVGETFNLTLVNRGQLLHDLTIPELGIHLVAAPGETTTTGLEVIEAGEYRILCTVPGHAQAGMSARMVVGAP
jgi:uncharacterized cupredoxin-like copper-binding protein